FGPHIPDHQHHQPRKALPMLQILNLQRIAQRLALVPPKRIAPPGALELHIEVEPGRLSVLVDPHDEILAEIPSQAIACPPDLREAILELPFAPVLLPLLARVPAFGSNRSRGHARALRPRSLPRPSHGWLCARPGLVGCPPVRSPRRSTSQHA